MAFANFTTQERLVLLFLSTTLVVGGIVKWTKLQNTPVLQIKTSSVNAEMQAFDRASHELNATGTDLDLVKTDVQAESNQVNGKININQATSVTLQELPGVGPTLADRIIVYRTEHGPFTQVEDLTLVRGIGPKMFEKIAKTISTD